MANYITRLKSREEVAEGTCAFRVERPQEFEFRAGQFLTLSLVDPPETDVKGNTRAFSIASAPGEPDLMVATRIRDTAFKRVLSRLPDGAQVKIGGPFGKMALPEAADQPFVFLVGGIGITPFRSIVLDAAARRLAHRIFLFYANRRPEDAAFFEELSGLEKEHPAYRLINTVTGEADHSWPGERGRIDRGMIERYVDDLRSAVYYVAGPAPMVDGISKSLQEAGVSSERVHAEKFAGY